MTKVFIDGKAGTTGLKIFDRLSCRADLELLTLPEELRKDTEARKEMLNTADIAFLCLPDAAAREAVSLIDNPHTVVIDTSTAHRTNPDWAYGFAELSEEYEDKIRSSKRIAVPGCHASGFIALVYPLVKAGVISSDTLLNCFSLTGYSGGGKQMIADYENDDRNAELSSPRQYGIAQSHKHIPEMMSVTGVENAPCFSPVVADFFSGMQVTVPLHKSQLNVGFTIDSIKDVYKNLYTDNMVTFVDSMDESGFISTNSLSGFDNMKITVVGNEDRILLIAVYDNLGKGASGAAVECMNIALGIDKTTSLQIKDVK
ncbi:MAG: N-acetyl-gamma-glutamyl-phosphate reductase [Ruminococcaceae bacterium]|nr:N-acetyl-gamma-glutamyl-phosphate reductase [Oscillospiraceae bacterium]